MFPTGSDNSGGSTRRDPAVPDSQEASSFRGNPGNEVDAVTKPGEQKKNVRRRPVILNGITISVSRKVVAQATVNPGVLEENQISASISKPWAVVVWDDPVNLMSYVTHVFMKYFGFSHCKAESLMMQVHMDGRAVVANGGRESMEQHVIAMHGYGLLATLEQAE